MLAKHLKLLNLSQNRLGSKGLQLIIEALKDNSSLESLFLNNCYIDDDGCYCLSRLLTNPRLQLRELHINSNRIGHAGLGVVFDTLAMPNKRLKYLDVALNVIEIPLLRSLRSMIEKNSTL